jgi:short-subunit dehydrogenase
MTYHYLMTTRSSELPSPAPGSTALVTGASSGIGVEIARSLAKRGHAITLVARRKDRLEQLAADLRAQHGVRVDVIACDVSDPAARAELLSELERLGLTVEILVNNAGYGTGGRFHTLDLERELGMVKVMNVASTIGFQPLLNEATYSATKAFSLTFTESLHGELKGTGVTVTALCPGPVKTEFMNDPGVSEGASMLPAPMWVDASVVAEKGVRGLERGRRTVVPGVLNKMSTWMGRHVNRSLLLATHRKLAG